MARTPGFDRDQALGSLVRQFWRHGYRGTSTEDLCTTAALGRSSLYNTFGTKDVVYSECLSAYLADASTGFEAVLGAPGLSAFDKVAALLEGTVEQESRRQADGEPTGCLAVNTLVELAGDPAHAPVVDQVNRDTRARLAALATCIRLGQATGEINAALDASAYAEFVNATIVGIRVASRGGAGADTLRAIAACALRSLA
ncbi:TetR/AcrR family transcriptional regulator [Cryptosporangium japonicum]|uniref:TetR/AcrR family transcriptional regulator n=1 Tax=Cryptosporangium japonicum TaxID=80872 RepID=A0ABN0TIS5_9ACTN